MTFRASAPGKLMLSGEYAVLDGAPAIVAAVQARAVATLEPGPDEGPASPEARETRRIAEERFGRTSGTMTVDVEALRSGAKKLGLGSSAAGAAAAAAVVATANGVDLDPIGARMAVLEVAMAGHRAVAPEGSGADVAASVLGDFVRFTRTGEAFEARPYHPDPDLVIRVVWTGTEARTSDLVAKVRAFRARDAAGYARAMGFLVDESHRFADAFEHASSRELVAAVRSYAEGMRALGEAASAPIVEAHLHRVIDIASRHGGAAKPSGAGGGDVAVAFFEGHEDLDGFSAEIEASGYVLLDLPLGGPGVRPLSR